MVTHSMLHYRPDQQLTKERYERTFERNEFTTTPTPHLSLEDRSKSYAFDLIPQKLQQIPNAH